jgi:hypothetical protein
VDTKERYQGVYHEVIVQRKQELKSERQMTDTAGALRENQLQKGNEESASGFERHAWARIVANGNHHKTTHTTYEKIQEKYFPGARPP